MDRDDVRTAACKTDLQNADLLYNDVPTCRFNCTMKCGLPSQACTLMYSSSAFACNLLVQQPASFLLRKDDCTVHFLQLLVDVTNLSRNQRHVVATQLYAMLHDVLNDLCLQWLTDSLCRRVGVIAQGHRKSSMLGQVDPLCPKPFVLE